MSAKSKGDLTQEISDLISSMTAPESISPTSVATLAQDIVDSMIDNVDDPLILSPISKTKLELATLIGANGLNDGQYVTITDRADGFPLIVRCIGSNGIAPTAFWRPASAWVIVYIDYNNGYEGETKPFLYKMDSDYASTFYGRIINPLGELYYFDLTGTIIAISGTSDGTSNMVAVNPGSTPNSNNYEFTHTDGRLRYTGEVTKQFSVNVTLSITPTNNNDFMVIGIAKNGNVQQGKVIQTLGTTSETETLSLHNIVELAENDYIEVYVGNMTGANNVKIKTLDISLRGE